MAVIAMGQEVQLRRRLRGLGYELRPSPVQDPKHPAYRGYMIVDIRQHLVVAAQRLADRLSFAHPPRCESSTVASNGLRSTRQRRARQFSVSPS